MNCEKVFKIIRKDIRCVNCGKLLLKAKLKQGCSIEIMCSRCKTINSINLFSKVEKELEQK